MKLIKQSLSFLYPTTAQDWHPTRNGDKFPFDFSYGSKFGVWWRCKRGHYWKNTIGHRSSGGQVCPFCKNIKACYDNNLSALYPKAAVSFHPTRNNAATPLDFLAGSSNKYWWKCEKGHRWFTTPSKRTSGQDCPFCKNRKVGFDNCLAFMNPSLALEWHSSDNQSKTPLDVPPNASNNIVWTCEKKHKWPATVNNRAKEKGCPYCTNQKVGKDNNLAIVNPKLALQFHPTENGDRMPFEIVLGCTDKIMWKCEKNHVWPATGYDRKSGSNCPKCNSNTSFGEQCIYFYIKQSFPNAKMWDKETGIEIDVLIPSTIPLAIFFDGEYPHRHRFEKDTVKSAKLVEEGFRVIRVRELPLNPIEMEGVYNVMIKEGHYDEMLAQLTALLEMFYPIKIDWDMNVDTYSIQILELYKDIFKERSVGSISYLKIEWHRTRNGSLSPFAFSLGSDVRVWWKCPKGHYYDMVIGERTRGRTCPFCTKKRVGTDNCLAALNPTLAIRWHTNKNSFYTPLDFTAKSGKQAWWMCHEGHEWERTIKNGSRSPNCPKHQ